MARVSGPEKSRHTKHSALETAFDELEAGIEEWTRGFVACNLDRSGRDPCGIGGGVLFAVEVLLGLEGMAGLLRDPPYPDSRASLISVADGVGGSRRGGRPGTGSAYDPFDTGSCSEGRRAGRRGANSPHDPFERVSCSEGRRGSCGTVDSSDCDLGRNGMLGREGAADDLSLPRKAEIFDVNPPILDLDSRGGGLVSTKSSLGRLGGNAGRSVSPHAGAWILPLPLELIDAVEAPRTPVAVVECEALDVTDSVEGLREVSVGRRGGSEGRASGRAGVGGGWRSDLRVGKGGGGFLAVASGRDGVGGGRDTGCDVRSSAGSFPIDAPSNTEPVTLYEGGLLADRLRSVLGRRNGG